MIAVSLSLAVGEIKQKIDMSHVTLSQKLILEHCAKRRRERHGEPEGDTFVHQSLHHAQQRNVSLGDRLEEPILLEKMLVFRMPNEWQMSVENERERTSHCGVRKEYQRADCSIRNPQLPIRNRLERPAKVLKAIQTFLNYVDARGVAQSNRPIIAEGRARDDRDICFA